MLLENVTNQLVGKALDVVMLNQQVIANNVANVNTQNYQALKVDFDALMADIKEVVQNGGDKEALKSAIQRLDLEQGAITEETIARVALDEQMVELTKNSLRYQALLNARGQLGSLVGMAIKGGDR